MLSFKTFYHNKKYFLKTYLKASQVALVQNPPASAGDTGSIPGWGRSRGEGNGNPLQYSCLGKSHGQRSLAGLVSQRVVHDLETKQQQQAFLPMWVNPAAVT